MKFTLEIELGNDEMSTVDDIAASLRDVAKTLMSQGFLFAQERSIRDINGNTVGKWEVTA